MELARQLRAVQGRRDLLEKEVLSLESAPAQAGPRARIKVLAGNGDMETARATADRLRQGGCPAPRVDLPEKPCRGTTVYFAPGYQARAEDIAARLEGEDTVPVQPLNWPSIFHIIVVTDTLP